VVAVLILLFLVVPVLEIWLIIQVGQVIGALPTVVLLVVESLLGAWLVKREGRRTWRALRASFGQARVPGRELLDGALVLVGGTLLLTPGFLTDVVGFFLVLPVTRPVARRALTAILARRLVPGPGVRHRRFRPGRSDHRDGRHGRDDSGTPRVIRGEVVDREDRPR
jgi:UPF0716 protein FxsA